MPSASETKTAVQGQSGFEESLLYLDCNISTETPKKTALQAPTEKVCKLSTSQRKTAFILRDSVQQMGDKYGIDRIGFLTLTFADHVICHKEAQKRLNSLITHVINPRYHGYIGCVERQKSGRIHYHFLIALDVDIRTGFNFKECEEKNYSSANKELRKEWSFWRKASKAHRFGRTEILPVKSNLEAMAKYIGKYISKHLEERLPSDKGARLVRYSRGARAGTTRFMFASEGSKDWRRQVAIFAQIVDECYQTGKTPEESRIQGKWVKLGIWNPDCKTSLPDDYNPPRIKTMADLTYHLGARWAFNNREFILSIP